MHVGIRRAGAPAPVSGPPAVAESPVLGPAGPAQAAPSGARRRPEPDLALPWTFGEPAFPHRYRRVAVDLGALLVVLATLGLLGWLAWTGLSGAPDVSTGEASFAAHAAALARGYSAEHLSWLGGGVAALQVAGYETVSGTLDRVAPVVAAREAGTVATLLTGVALAVTARRLRLSVPASAAVLALYAAVPAAVLLHRTAVPVDLATMWAAVAVAVTAGGVRRPGTAVVAGAALLLAVLSAPVVLLAVVPFLTALLVSGDVGRLPMEGRAGVAVLGLLAESVLVLFAGRGTLIPGPTGMPLPTLSRLDVVLAGLAAVAAVLAIRVRWLRSLAVATVAVALAVVVTDRAARGSVAVVAVALNALLMPGLAEAASVGWSRWWTRRSSRAGLQPGRGRWLVPAVGCTAAATAGLLGWLPHAPALRDRTGGATAYNAAVEQARNWVLTALPSRPAVAVDQALWVPLMVGGYPADKLVPVADLAGARSLPTDPVFVVGVDAALHEAGPADPVRQALAASSPVAAFGTGAERVSCRRVINADSAPVDAAAQQRSRVAAGTALIGNSRLRLTSAAAALLRAGAVDGRALAVLAGISAQHAVEVSAFPAVPGEDSRLPRRLVAVTAVDGQPVASGSSTTDVLVRWLSAQQPPFRPGTSVQQIGGRAAVLLRYDALNRADVLPQ